MRKEAIKQKRSDAIGKVPSDYEISGAKELLGNKRQFTIEAILIIAKKSSWSDNIDDIHPDDTAPVDVAAEADKQHLMNEDAVNADTVNNKEKHVHGKARLLPRLIDKTATLFNSFTKFAKTLPSCDPLNTDFTVKNILMTLLAKSTNRKELYDFGNYALRLSNENRDKLVTIEDVKDKKHFRNIIWENQFGVESCGICPLCNQTVLKWYSSDWDISHIISRKEGGPFIEANLRPTCRSCNLSVGSDSLYMHARILDGALERLKLIDFLKVIPESDPTRFQEKLDREQLHLRMQLIDKKYEQENSVIRLNLQKEKKALEDQRNAETEKLRKLREAFEEEMQKERDIIKAEKDSIKVEKDSIKAEKDSVKKLWRSFERAKEIFRKGS